MDTETFLFNEKIISNYNIIRQLALKTKRKKYFVVISLDFLFGAATLIVFF